MCDYDAIISERDDNGKPVHGTLDGDCAAFLVGETIEHMWLDDEVQHVVLMRLVSGRHIVLHVYGGCCSESWIYAITNIGAAIGHKVTGIVCQALGLAGDDDRTRRRIDLLYSVTLITAGGYCDIEFRNSNNSYLYGGEARIFPVDIDADMILVEYEGPFHWHMGWKDIHWRELTRDY